MISKNLLNRKSKEDFEKEARYLGLAIHFESHSKITEYTDLESFFLSGTYHMISSRTAESFICWAIVYGHLLSPSKLRRFIQAGVNYNPAVLGAIISYLHTYCPSIGHQIKILIPFVKSNKAPVSLLRGPTPQKYNPHFIKYNVIAFNFLLDKEKFLRPVFYTLKNCTELKNRALFGSVVNADVASYLKWHPTATPYEISKNTGHHKSSVFKVFENIKIAM